MDLDLSTITDIEKLEALAYRQIIAMKQAEHNLQAIQVRMAQVEQDQAKENPAKK